MIDLLDKIKENTPAHMTETIKDCRSLIKKSELFASEISWQNSAAVNVFNVNGSCHPDYVGLTWFELLHKGKRMSQNLQLLETNPDYYLESQRKNPSMYITEIGSNVFVEGDGNHRTCIAKGFLFYKNITELKGVTVRKIVKDDGLENIFDLIRNAPESSSAGIYAEPVRSHISRKDAPGWQTDIYESKICIRNKKNNKILVDAAEAINLYTELKSGPLMRRFRFNKYAKFICS